MFNYCHSSDTNDISHIDSENTCLAPAVYGRSLEAEERPESVLHGEAIPCIVRSQACDRRVAIIGAGWCGLQILQCLLEEGINVELFDKFDCVGGTWTPYLSYFNLHCHTPRWFNCCMANGEIFPYGRSGQQFMDEKANAAEVHEYLHNFVIQHQLDAHIHRNRLVQEVHYNTESCRAELVVQDVAVGSATSGEKFRTGPYDLVVHASMSGKPSMPDLENWGFQGKLLHSSNLHADVIQEIKANNLQVAVVGAGKSGTDIVCALKTEDCEFAWLMRRPYWFLRYEKIFHDRGWYSMMRGFLPIVGLCIFGLFPTIGLIFLWVTGFATLPMAGLRHFHLDANKFHFGIMDQKQLSCIQHIKPIFGDPLHLCKEGLALKNGQVVSCDLVVFATGYRTGFGDFDFFKDGQPYQYKDQPLFEHHLIPDFPVFLSASTAFYQFGPVRGVSTAQYIMIHFSRGQYSEQTMRIAASKQWCKQSCDRYLGYDGKSCHTRMWLLMYVDFVMAAVVSFSALFNLAVQIFVYGVYKPLHLLDPGWYLIRAAKLKYT